MIFDSNTTSLATNIPMAEGYDGTVGAAMALVESAQNDYAMFRAMLDIDARELMIHRESTGFVAESQISSLHEAAAGGIWTKICELFKKLAAKLKSIVHNFMAKINGLYMDDKKLVKKYQNDILRKTNLGNLEVKWRKVNNGIGAFAGMLSIPGNADGLVEKWADTAEARWKGATNGAAEDSKELREKFDKEYWKDDAAELVKLSELGGARAIMNSLEGFGKAISDYNKKASDVTKAAEKLVNDANKKANETAAASKGEGATKTEEDVVKANHAHDMALVVQDVALIVLQCGTAALKEEYRQTKAAFMKAVAANDKKLEENAIYLDAVAEAAEQEVDDVIDNSIGEVDVASSSVASLNVKDADVSDDPNALTYAPDHYGDTGAVADVAGAVDTDVDSKIDGKSESAFFGQLLY